jgi:hypothetical protein
MKGALKVSVAAGSAIRISISWPTAKVGPSAAAPAIAAATVRFRHAVMASSELLCRPTMTGQTVGLRV